MVRLQRKSRRSSQRNRNKLSPHQSWCGLRILRQYTIKKKPPTYVGGFLVFALPIFTVRACYRPAVRNSPVDCCRQKKPRPYGRGFFVFALPIFTASHPATIVGVHVLNFCVRDGNRWTHMTINTNFGDPYRIRTDVNGVRGRCLNHLTNGPLVHLQGLEPGTH